MIRFRHEETAPPEHAEARLNVQWKGHSAITENKRLGEVLAYIKER